MKMKIRRAVVNITQDKSSGGNIIYTFSYPEVKLDFKVSQTDTEQPDNCLVRIYGVDRKTHNIFNIEKNKGYIDTQRVEVFYGYDEDLELVFSGTIDRVIYSFDNGAQVLTLLITKNTRRFLNMKRSISMLEPQTIASAVNYTCYTFGYKPILADDDKLSSISVGRVCATGTLYDVLREILPDGYDFYIGEDTVYVYGEDKSISSSVTLYSQNGLLSFPTSDTKEEKTSIKCVLLPGVESGMQIKIPIDEDWYTFEDTGTYKTFIVRNYSSVFQNGIGVTELECDIGGEN